MRNNFRNNVFFCDLYRALDLYIRLTVPKLQDFVVFKIPNLKKKVWVRIKLCYRTSQITFLSTQSTFELLGLF